MVSVAPAAPDTWPVRFEVVAAQHAQDTVVIPGQPYSSAIPISNPGADSWSGKVTFTLLDFHETPCAAKIVPLTLAAGESRTLNIAFTPKERGIFKVEAKIAAGGKTWTRDVSSFAVWPRPTHPPRLDSFFGNHVNSWQTDLLAQASELGQGWNRDHDMLQATWWPRVEPDKGVWAYNSDGQLAGNLKYKMPVLGTFFGTPYWAAASGPLTKQEGTEFYPYGAVPNMDAFKEYVTHVVDHNKQSIHYWEIGNEPEVSSFWTGTFDKYAEKCKIGYEAAKAADPSCTVVVGGFTNSAWNWHEEVAKAGALRWADVISSHYYFGAEDVPENTYDWFKSVTDHWHALNAKYAQGRQLPLWDTEGGSSDTTWLRGLDYPNLPPESARGPMNWKHAAYGAVQSDAILQSLGVVRSFYYFQNNVGANADGYVNLSMLDVTLAPKPKLMARVVMQDQVDGAKFAGMVRRPGGRFWANVYQKENNGGSVVLWWVGENGKVKVTADWPGKLAEAVDLMGNSHPSTASPVVTDEPCYLHVAAPADEVIKALNTARLTVLYPAKELAKPTQATDAPDIPKLPPYAAPVENPKSLFTVDLRKFANMAFADTKQPGDPPGWAGEGPLNDLRTMPLGRQTFYGVPFDVIDPKTNGGKAVITLRGTNAAPGQPVSSTGIPLGNRTVRNLYFLHSSAWGSPAEIAHYTVHYADGQTVDIPVRIPVNSGDWWSAYQKGEQSKPAAVRVTNTTDGKPAWRYLRVWEWQNPRPDVPLASLDFVSASGASTPILIAVSGV